MQSEGERGKKRQFLFKGSRRGEGEWKPTQRVLEDRDLIGMIDRQIKSRQA